MSIIKRVTFEFGNTLEFDSVVGTPTVSRAAALVNGYGMYCDGAQKYGVYNFVPATNEVTIRFYANFSGATFDSGDSIDLLSVYHVSSLVVFYVYVRRVGDNYICTATMFDDTGGTTHINIGFDLVGTQMIEVYIKRETADGEADGVFTARLNGADISTDSTIENYNLFAAISRLHFGLTRTLDPAGWDGFVYVDDLVVDDGSSIGAASSTPIAVLLGSATAVYDVTGFVVKDDFTYESIIGSQVDTASVTLKYDASYTVSDWNEIAVIVEGDKVFAGYVLMIDDDERTTYPDHTLRYKLGLSDYGARLSSIPVNSEYEAKTDAYILDAIFTASLTDFDASTYVSAIKTHDNIRFNKITLLDVIEQLADLAGADWYIDYDKCLHFYISEENEAPFNINTDSPDGTAEIDPLFISKNTDGSEIANVVIVSGGYHLSDDSTNEFPGEGTNTKIPVWQRIHKADGESGILAWRNDGGASTNYVNNPRFEVNITDSWTQAGTGGTFTRDTGTKYTGSASCKIVAGSTAVSLNGANVSINPGETATVSVRCYADAVGIGSVVVYDVSNSAERDKQYNRKTSAWEWLTASWYNDTGAAANVRIEIHNEANDSSGITYFDACQLEKQTWPSDHINGAMGTGYAWSGTADNSSSTRSALAGDIWTPLTVKVGYISDLESRDEAMFYFNEMFLEQETFWPNLGNALRITGRYETPVIVRRRNNASISHYGMEMTAYHKDADIVDQEVAALMAQSILVKNSMSKTAVFFSTYEPGLRAGQTIEVTNALQGLSGEYIIQRVNATILRAGDVDRTLFDVECGIYQQDLIDMLIRLSRRSKPVLAWRDDEVLNEILDIYEAVKVRETLTGVAATDTYRWGPGDDEFLWDFGMWQ